MVREGSKMWTDNVIVNGVLFRVDHFGWHPLGQMLTTSTCDCDALLAVQCSECGATSEERTPEHVTCRHAEVLV